MLFLHNKKVVDYLSLFCVEFACFPCLHGIFPGTLILFHSPKTISSEIMNVRVNGVCVCVP